MAAPLGNKFALGISNSGKPPIFNSEKEIEDKINAYFESLLNEDQTQYTERPTITGLALYLGFASRQSLYDYGKKEEYSYIIKRAKVVIEMSYEQMLLTKSATGAIFALKNMGWIDKSLLDSTSSDGSMSPKSPLTKEQAKKINDLLEDEC